MNRSRYAFAAFVLTILPGSYLALAQQNTAQQHAMTFFVTTVGTGKGANLGGLASADAYYHALATANGAAHLYVELIIARLPADCGSPSG
jgi:hypothetical protein